MTRKPILRLYFRISVLLTLLAVLGQSLLYFLSFDCTLYLYERGPLPTVLGVCVALAVLFMLSFILTAKKEEVKDSLPPLGRSATFTAALTGFFILATLLLALLYSLNGLETDALSTPVAVAANIFSIPAACYFFITALNPSPNPKTHAAFGCTLVIWLILYTLAGYFHMNFSINSPLKVYNQIALLSAMLYFLHEVRYSLGRQKPAQHKAFGMAAMLLLATASLPTLLLTFSFRISITSDTIYYLAELAMALYIFTRLSDCANEKSVVQNPSDPTAAEETDTH